MVNGLHLYHAFLPLHGTNSALSIVITSSVDQNYVTEIKEIRFGDIFFPKVIGACGMHNAVYSKRGLLLKIQDCHKFSIAVVHSYILYSMLAFVLGTNGWSPWHSFLVLSLPLPLALSCKQEKSPGKFSANGVFGVYSLLQAFHVSTWRRSGLRASWLSMDAHGRAGNRSEQSHTAQYNYTVMQSTFLTEVVLTKIQCSGSTVS